MVCLLSAAGSGLADIDVQPFENTSGSSNLNYELRAKDLRNMGLVQIDQSQRRDLIITTAQHLANHSVVEGWAMKAIYSAQSPKFDLSPIGLMASESNLRKYASGVIFADFDNDGDLDFYAPNPELGHQLFRYDSASQVFEDVTDSWGLNNTSAGYPSNQLTIGGVWGDFNGDSLVDLLVLYGNNEETGSSNQFLWRNTGSGFVDASVPVPGSPNAPYAADFYSSLKIRSAHWVDFDQDNDLDLLLVQGDFISNINTTEYWENKSGENQSLLQTNSSFVSEVVARLNNQWTLSTIADMDNDGFVDVVWESSTGYGIALYDQSGHLGHHKDVTLWGSAEYAHTWDIAPADVDLDGREDILSFVYGSGTNRTLYFTGEVDNNGPYLYQNQYLAPSFGACVADFMEDGLTEVFLSASFLGTSYSVVWDVDNDDALDRKWVGFKLSAPNGLTNRDAIGTILKVAQSGISSSTQAKVVDGGNGFASQRDMYLQYGLNSFSGTVDVEAVVPNKNASRDGSVVRLKDVPSGQYWKLILDAVFDVSATMGYDVSSGELTMSLTWYSYLTSGNPSVADDQVNFFIEAPDAIVVPQATYKGGGSITPEYSQGRYRHDMTISGLPCEANKKFYFSVQGKSGSNVFASEVSTKTSKYCLSSTTLP